MLLEVFAPARVRVVGVEAVFAKQAVGHREERLLQITERRFKEPHPTLKHVDDVDLDIDDIVDPPEVEVDADDNRFPQRVVSQVETQNRQFVQLEEIPRKVKGVEHQYLVPVSRGQVARALQSPRHHRPQLPVHRVVELFEVKVEVEGEIRDLGPSEVDGEDG